MSLVIPIEAFDNFKAVKDYPITEIPEGMFIHLVQAVREMDERDAIEPFIRAILADGAQTPHGPAEIVDILTHRVSVSGRHGMAAFILKGKLFPTVRPADVAHQIYRLKKIHGLTFAVFAAPGIVLDGVKEQFSATCNEIPCHHSIFNADDLVRLFVAYGFLCPHDASLISSGRCKCGYSPKKRVLNILQAEALDGLADAHATGQKTGLIVLPPGTGKTRIAAEDAICINANCVLYIAHTDEILDVAQSEFEAKFGSSQVLRLETGDYFSHLNRVNIATIQLLSKNLDKLSDGRFDYLVIDEFHHAAAKSYRRVLDKLHPAFPFSCQPFP